MFRPTRLGFPLLTAALTLTLTGCGTIYDDMYSPRRSRFVPPPPKATEAEVELPPVDTSSPSDILPPPPADPTAPAPADPLGIPGMEPMPGAPAPGMEPVPAIPGL